LSDVTHALIATVYFHDAVVDQRRVRRGIPLVLDGRGPVAIPLPAGASHLARCTWEGGDRVHIVDGRGRAHVLGPGSDVRIAVGPVAVSLALAPQFSLRRVVPIPIVASIAWLTIFLMGTVSAESGELVWENRCVWFGVACPPPGSHSINDWATAEYLARLLKEDYSGDDEGAITRDIDREKSEKAEKSFYLPAGNNGPIDKMGGADDIAIEPVRTPEEALPAVPKVGGQDALLALDDADSEVELTAFEDDDAGDGIVEDQSEEDDIDALERPTEEERGWGMRDWYDVQDERLDNLEVELMIATAKRQLAIDPDSQQALSVLAYYQYLGQDLDGAFETYDRYIRLFPDESAGYNNKALVYKRHGDYEIEERMYRVALALDPGDVTAMNNLAVCLSHLGRHDEAVALMVELETLDPGDAYADLHRAKIHAQNGEEATALSYLDKALAGMKALDTLHHIEFRQDIRVDPSFAKLRETRAFRDILVRYYGQESPLKE
jgi:tetratricopeptide (TPR) repeat protein